MNDTEKIREFIERVKGWHHQQGVTSDALRAVLALEEMLAATEFLQGCSVDESGSNRVRSAWARAAQKIGEKQ